MTSKHLKQRQVNIIHSSDDHFRIISEEMPDEIKEFCLNENNDVPIEDYDPLSEPTRTSFLYDNPYF